MMKNSILSSNPSFVRTPVVTSNRYVESLRAADELELVGVTSSDGALAESGEFSSLDAFATPVAIKAQSSSAETSVICPPQRLALRPIPFICFKNVLIMVTPNTFA